VRFFFFVSLFCCAEVCHEQGQEYCEESEGSCPGNNFYIFWSFAHQKFRILQQVRQKIQQVRDRVKNTVQKVRDRVNVRVTFCLSLFSFCSFLFLVLQKIKDRVQKVRDRVKNTVQKVKDRVQKVRDRVNVCGTFCFFFFFR
jgi:ElaB/YqjD/DUF883 family membrane-anchored ribosome-binding protein